MSMNIKMLVCCHKPGAILQEEPYFPIHVGKALSNTDLGIQGDNTGDNISSKNESYCELTGMYWAWKNFKGVDYVGLCHYRRFFDFHNQCGRFYSYSVVNPSRMKYMNLSIPEKIISKLDDQSIILPVPISYEVSLYNDYCRCHISDDLRLLEDIIIKRQDPLLQDAFNKVMYRNNKLRHYNMFIMKWTLFDEYCKWLFDLLGDVEKVTDISNYNKVQKRIYGYMAERLLNVFVVERNLKVLEKKVIWFNDNPVKRDNPVKYVAKRMLNSIAFAISRPVNY